MRQMLRVANILIDILGFFGVGLLAIPALHASQYATQAARLSQARTHFADADLRKRRADILKSLQALRDDWRPWKANCLKYGTILAALSYLLSLATKITG
jgi:hypothetical protein